MSKNQFASVLKGKNNIIAEFKRYSPSKGRLTYKSPAYFVKEYECYANAVSIITNSEYFQGCIKDLREARKVTAMPLLRKDFITKKSQVYESYINGANAVLLIASIVDEKNLQYLLNYTMELGMDALVEVHTKPELDKVLKINAPVIGINNRDLNTMKVDLSITKELLPHIPRDRIVVSESGYHNINDIKSVNANAFLVGSSLVTASSPSEKLQDLVLPKLKICGVTNEQDSLEAEAADFVGFNFYKGSPRYITPEKARNIISKLSNSCSTVGIFVNEEKNKIMKIASDTGLDYLQFHGEETADFCNNFSLPVIKGVRVKDNLPSLKDYNVYAFLFDKYKSILYGGTGEKFNHDLLKGFKSKVFLAGGLDENLDTDYKPYCFDVCSGVEKQEGIKDHNKIKELIEKVKNYES